MTQALRSDEKLKDACSAAKENYDSKTEYLDWLNKLAIHLTYVKSVSKADFFSKEFQKKLWNGQVISAFGQGDINVDKVIDNTSIVERLWQLHTTVLPDSPSDRIEILNLAWDDCMRLIGSLVERTPRLKLYSVFATLKPTDFTTVAHVSKLRRLGRAMAIDVGKAVSGIEIHRRILDRLAGVLGSTSEPPERAGLERMTLPWLLFATKDDYSGAEAASILGVQAGSETLIPLPADRRRRGMLAIGGALASIRSMIEFAKEGCSREDFKEHIRSINPRLAPNSVGSNLNALIGDWGVLNAVGDQLSLTERGEALLDSGDPDEVSDWLLTHILGFDNILLALRDQPSTKPELLSLLQQVNPGWTSDFAPNALINWIRALGLVVPDQNKIFGLTDEGRNWASRIHWKPEFLSPSMELDEAVRLQGESGGNEKLQRPSLQNLCSNFPGEAIFDNGMIARLDAGLWSNERRHFAVLAGLSGAGKTSLARNYALALWQGESDPKQGLYTLPVQPGWHDPSSILGYVNPLSSSTYVRTGFLDFLLKASVDPGRPYTVVLDEMNLSHPEQYLAPLLSAMETGENIEFHTLEEDIGGVPAYIKYPDNLLLIGTVNMDETTHGLSDKILDRASIMEFWDVDVSAYPGWKASDLSDENLADAQHVLVVLSKALRPAKLHFGWRTVGDILGYLKSADMSGMLDFKTALDHAIFAKILPKLRGEDSKRLRLAFEQTSEILKIAKLEESFDKLNELLEDLRDIGSARFWR